MIGWNDDALVGGPQLELSVPRALLFYSLRTRLIAHFLFVSAMLT